VDSINTKNGFNQSGAPSGRKCAVEALGAWIKLDIMRLSHSGRPNDSVIIRCLDNLNEYGLRPRRLVIIRRINRVEMIRVKPFIKLDWVRSSCDTIISLT